MSTRATVVLPDDRLGSSFGDHDREGSMGEIVLVHGAWHGPWCWESVAPGLEAKGHVVRTPVLHRGSLQADVAAVQAELDGLGDQVVVCGHSYGGMVISGLRPAGIRTLVYLTAIVAEPGESSMDVSGMGPPPAIRSMMVFSDDGTCTLEGADVAGLFYADCPVDVQQAAISRLQPQFASCLAESNPGAAWHDVPSVYIRCTEDRAMDPDLQLVLGERIGNRQDWPGSHSPFFSQPDRLVDLLSDLGTGL
jgi:pimeloyl-ACP methyl ester carboxylesterase